MNCIKTAVVLSAGSALTLGPLPFAEAHDQERSIAGVWTTVVTPRNCQTGQPLPVPRITGLFTFHTGGTMSEWGVAGGSSPALRGPGHGLWHREHGWRDYSFTFIHYRYDAVGAFIGAQKVAATLELAPSGDAFETDSAVAVLDASSNVIATFCATAQGTRFE